jgi:TadE-like protein.
MINRFISQMQSKNRGQSYVELALVLLILAFMLTGVVEYGMLLNNYLKVLDGTREGARLASQMVAFDLKTQVSDEEFYVITASKTISAMTTINLNGNTGDDIIISVFSVAGTSSIRYPQGYTNGWSLCSHFLEITTSPKLEADMNIFLTPKQYTIFKNDWGACTLKTSKFSTDKVDSSMGTSTFNSGIVLVEIYYNYPQMLKMPIFEQMGDPIPVYTYSMMPMGSAMPTPVP